MRCVGEARFQSMPTMHSANPLAKVGRFSSAEDLPAEVGLRLVLLQATEGHGGVPAAQHPLERRHQLVSDASLVGRRVGGAGLVEHLAGHVREKEAQFLGQFVRWHGRHLPARLFTSHFFTHCTARSRFQQVCVCILSDYVMGINPK